MPSLRLPNTHPASASAASIQTVITAYAIPKFLTSGNPERFPDHHPIG